MLQSDEERCRGEKSVSLRVEMRPVKTLFPQECTAVIVEPCAGHTDCDGSVSFFKPCLKLFAIHGIIKLPQHE